MDYGKAIRIVRSAHRLSQAELAGMLSISASQLSLIESGKRNPTVRVLDEVAAVLGVPPHLLRLLASEPKDLDQPQMERDVGELAKSLLRVLVSAGHTPVPSLETNESEP